MFLNLPLWANFYNSTDLSHTTTTTATTFRPKKKVEAGWGMLRPSLLGLTLLDDLNSRLRQVEAGCGKLRPVEASWGQLRQVEASWGRLRPVEARPTAILLGWNSVVFWPSPLLILEHEWTSIELTSSHLYTQGRVFTLLLDSGPQYFN